MHLGEGGPAAAPRLALPDCSVLYGGVVHWAKAPHLWSAGHHVSWQMVYRSSCVMANGLQVIMCHGKWSVRHYMSWYVVSQLTCVMANGL